MMSTLSSEILNEVRKNQAVLAACPRHSFQQITPGLFGTRWVCAHCKGTADGVSVKWYESGLVHAAVPLQKVA